MCADIGVINIILSDYSYSAFIPYNKLYIQYATFGNDTKFKIKGTEAAILAAEHKQRRDITTTDNKNSEDHVLNDPNFDNKGSLWYRKQQRI